MRHTQWGGVGGGGADSVRFDFSPWNPKQDRDISVWAGSRKCWYLQDFCGLESRLGFMSEGFIQVPKS